LTIASKVRKNGKKSEKMQTMLQNVNKFTKKFLAVWLQKPWWELKQVGVEGGAQEVKIDLMPPGVPKVSNFSLFWIFRAASCGRPQSLPRSVSFYLR
jgi:hypothetical protein